MKVRDVKRIGQGDKEVLLYPESLEKIKTTLEEFSSAHNSPIYLQQSFSERRDSIAGKPPALQM